MSLFDLQNDPGEQKDVAGQHADVVARLKGHYDRLVQQFPGVGAAPVKP
jgi:hypothetical protein